MLKTRNNPLWRPYTAAKEMAPGFIRRLMPRWREPKETRLAAAWWVGHFGPGFPEAAVPVLCEIATSDPERQVRRAAINALRNIEVYSAGAVPVMLSTLVNETDRDTRLEAAEWFKQTTPIPEMVVPILLKLLEEDPDTLVREACVYSLASYGHRAHWALGPLKKLARADDRFMAWAASRVLKDIDPAIATPVDIFRPRGQKPAVAFREITLLTEEGRLGDEKSMEASFAKKALGLGGDAVILHNIKFIGSYPNGPASFLGHKVLYKASVIVYEPGRQGT